MTTPCIVGKFRNLCNVGDDDGVACHRYVTDLTYVLFLQRNSSLQFLFLERRLHADQIAP
jgi:hypothetical protein